MSKNELKKEIGLVPALALVIGMVIGSGVFFKPRAVFSCNRSTRTWYDGMGFRWNNIYSRWSYSS